MRFGYWKFASILNEDAKKNAKSFFLDRFRIFLWKEKKLSTSAFAKTEWLVDKNMHIFGGQSAGEGQNFCRIKNAPVCLFLHRIRQFF